MKKIFILGLTLLGISANLSAQITYTWTGATSSDFFEPTNWLNNDGNSPDIANDDVLFNAGSVDCDISSGVTIGSFSVLSGYTGTINLGGSSHTFLGNVLINGGTVIGTSADLTVSYATSGTRFEVGASGTYSSPSTGSLIVQLPGGATTYSFIGTIPLSHLRFDANASGTSIKTIDFGTGVAVNNISFVNTNSTKAFSFLGSPHIKVGMNISTLLFTNTSVVTTGTLIFDGANANIVGVAAATTGWLPNIQINLSSPTNTYAMSGNINMRGTNWTVTQGILSPGTSTVNMFTASSSITGGAGFDNLVLQASSSVTFPASTEVFISRNLNIISGATTTFASGNILSFNGTGSQSISGSITPQNIIIYSGTTTFGSAVTLMAALTVTTGATLNTGGLLTLHADASGTGRIAESGGTINGNVTVETFLPGPDTGWGNLGTPGVQGQTVANWDTYVSSSGANGIPMSCTGCQYDPTTVGNFTSIQGWDEGTNDYDATLTSATALTPGTGFWVYVGDGPVSTNGLKLINTGAPVTGPVSIPVPNNNAGLSLIANPYPSPINWDNVYLGASNGLAIDGAVYAWSADNGGQITSYVPFVGGTPGAPNGIDNIIPAGQGFHVQNAGIGFTSLDFDETMKAANPSNNLVVKPSGNNDIQKFRLKIKGAQSWDAMLFAFKSDATAFYDSKYDAKKIFKSPGYLGYPGPYDKYTTISCKDAFGLDYSIHSMAPLTESVSIPVLARVSTSGTYTISAYDFKDFTSCIGLIDRTDNSFHDLRASDYVFTISDTTSKPRFDLVLCRDESINTTGIAQLINSNSILINQDQQGAFVKTVFSKNTKATISAYNIVGQKVMDDITVEGTATDTRLNLDMKNQIVIIRVVADKEISTKKIVMH